ncbi:type II toxin-antitoxin system HicB family antitoxin [Bdellovibrio sp. HCB290]|uniref:type II toxin-antitoxin system HicB family antitoxin n=1 Tax=Bdellovibrio sp. HCB290 TaxID=3394356 RepID=UPI0039B47465
MEYHFKIHKEKSGFSAECIELEGCRTQGDTMSELEQNMGEALNLYLAENDSSMLVFPAPKKNTGKNIVAVGVEPGVAFAMHLRQSRLSLSMTQGQMMQLLGIKTLSNYQRLEDPKRANPELKTLAMILKVVPQIKIGNIVGSENAIPKKKVS